MCNPALPDMQLQEANIILMAKSKVFESCSGLASGHTPKAFVSMPLQILGGFFYRMNVSVLHFNAMCTPLKQSEYSFGVCAIQLYQMCSCTKQSERPKVFESCSARGLAICPKRFRPKLREQFATNEFECLGALSKQFALLCN